MDIFSRDIWCLNGLPFDAVDMESAIRHIEQSILEQEPFFLSTPNLNFLIAAQTDETFRHSVINSDLSVADGMPIIWIARLLQIPLPERVTGSGLMEALFAERSGAPIRVYFFGGEPGVGERACAEINQSDSRLQAVGSYCPGFGSVEAMSNDDIIAEINRHTIDFIIVALGAKKGQAWIEHNRHRLHAPVISHLGAVINFFAGTVKRAPVWLQRIGFEWLWRITQEPALWKRYVFDGLAFVKLLTFQVIPHALWIRMNQLQLNDNRPVKVEVVEEREFISVTLTGALTANTIAELKPIFRELSEKEINVRIDLQHATVIDGAFLGLCLLLYKCLNTNGCRLSLANAGKANTKIIRWSRVDFLLD